MVKFVVWKIDVGAFFIIQNLLQNIEVSEKYRALIKGLFKVVFKEIEFYKRGLLKWSLKKVG